MNILGLLIKIKETFYEMAPYLLLGLTFAGVLHVLFKKELIVRHLGGEGAASWVKAAVMGVPLPLCSCGVIPTALSLRKSGASKPATLSFLISTPQTGVDSIIATYGMLGPVFAVFRPFAALLMGIFGGFAAHLFRSSDSTVAAEEKSDENNGCRICGVEEKHGHSFIEKIKSMFTYAFGEFLDDISVQLIIGITISGLISYYIPDNFFSEYIGNTFLGMLLMIIAGIPLYVCATASIPIAATMMIKGLSPGAAFVFLAVGPATNAATVTLVSNAMGKKIAAIYLGAISSGAILFGFLLNYVYKITGSDVVRHTYQSHGTHETVFSSILPVIFALLLILSLIRKFGFLTNGQNGHDCCSESNEQCSFHDHSHKK